MTRVRDHLIGALWRGRDPFAGVSPAAAAPSHPGWGSDHPWLAEAVAAVRPRLVIEVGVWTGGSALTLARAMREAGIEGCVLCVDTWLGGWDHWLADDLFAHLQVEAGRPTLQSAFMANVVHHGLEGFIVPLPLDSLNASIVAGRLGLRAGVIHLDGGHDYAAVSADIRAWWSLLQPGGILLGDDYRTDGGWPEVKRAFDVFAAERQVTLVHRPTKCRIVKGAEP